MYTVRLTYSMMVVIVLALGCTEHLTESPLIVRGSAEQANTGSDDPQPMCLRLPAEIEGDTKGCAHPRREQLFERRFGVVTRDPYRWMENPHDMELDPWIKAENAATSQYLRGPLFDELQQELADLLQISRKSSGRVQQILQQTQQRQLKDRFIRRHSPGFPVQHPLLNAAVSSASGRYVVQTVSDSGSDLVRLEIIDTDTGNRLDEVLMTIWPEVWWDEDEQSFLYLTNRDGRMGHTTDAILRHRLGTSQAADTLIYEAPRADVSLGLYPTEAGWVLAHWTLDEVDLGWFDIQTGEVKPVVEDAAGPFYVVGSEGEFVYAQRYNDAPLGELVKIDMNDGSMTQVVPQMELAMDNALKIGDSIYISFVEDSASRLVHVDEPTGTVTPIDIPQEGWAYLFQSGDSLLLYLTTYTRAYYMYLYDATQHTLTQIAQAEPPPFELESFRTFYTAHNGQEVPIWIIKRPEVPLNPDTPVMLYGYGGFGVNLLPHFSKTYLPWYRRGGVLAVVTLPGGFEYGEQWHRAGMGHHKINVFEDFAAAAQHLIDRDFTSPHRLAASGGSNGGLLVAAVINLYPQLFRVAIPQVGVMDLTRFSLFTGGKWWMDDYGDRDLADEYRNQLTISPYHNIELRAYPSTLVMTGEFDDRVVPSHSFKYAAQLQLHQLADRPILLHTARWASHGGYGTNDERLKAYASKLAFFIKELAL